LYDWRTALVAAAFLPFAVLLVLFIYRDLLSTAEVKSAVASSKTAEPAKGDIFDFLRLPAVWMCFAFFFISSIAGGGIQSFSSAGLRALYDNMSLAWATTCFTAYLLGSTAGMVCGGFLAAKTSRPERTIALAFATAALLALVIASGLVPVMMVLVLMVAIGFGSGIAGPSRDLLIRAASPKNATGRVYGIVYSGLDIGMAIAPVLFGAMMDSKHPAWVFAFIGIFQLAAIPTAVGIGTRNARKAVSAQAA
jgi:MFS family permease